MATTRRSFLLAGAGALGALSGCAGSQDKLGGTRGRASTPWFRISLAEWSLHRALQGGAMTNLDFPAKARDFGLEGVEYVNTFFKDKARDGTYLAELSKRCDDAGVKSLLIMCDGEGALADRDAGARAAAVESHRKWLEAAQRLGCHAIRVNAAGGGEREDAAARAADALHKLGELARPMGLDVIVENHGGLSSDGEWLAGVMRRCDHPRVGTLPDFGNFDLGNGRTYDRYRGVSELMPFARAVSAKSHDFDARGEETSTDYLRMLRIVRDAGYRAWVGIEYEGARLGEDEGIASTLRLLERVRAELA